MKVQCSFGCSTDERHGLARLVEDIIEDEELNNQNPNWHEVAHRILEALLPEGKP